MPQAKDQHKNASSSRPTQISIQSGSLNWFYNLKQTVYNEPPKAD